MEFGIYDVSYKEANANMRDCTAFPDTQKMELYSQLLSVDTTQAVIPSTCNRSELYFMYEKEGQLDQIRKLFLAVTGKAVPLFLKTGVTTACYLFEVAAGYHSMVFGEDQILGQIQSCYQMANQCQACGEQLHRIFQSCLAAVKQLKTAYKVSEHPMSVVYLAVKNIRNVMSLRSVSVLVIGSGEMAALVLQYLQEEELSTLYVCSRSRYKARQMVSAVMEYVPFSKRYEVLPYCDVICSMITSPHRILRREGMPPIDRKQLYVGLAMLGDIGPQLAQGRRVAINIDHLQREASEQLEQRRALLQKARTILETAIQEAYASLHSQEVDHLIQSLQRRSEQMAADIYALLQTRLRFSPHEQQVLKGILHTSFLRMVKEPMLALKKAKGQDRQLYARLPKTILGGN